MLPSEYSTALDWLKLVPSPVGTFPEFLSLASAIDAQKPWTPVFKRFPLDMSSLVCTTYQSTSARYERLQRILEIKTDGFKVPFRKVDINRGGLWVPFSYPMYGWFVNGTLIATASVSVTSPSEGIFLVTFPASFTDGLYESQILPVNPDGSKLANPIECYPPYLFWINRQGLAKNDTRVAYQNASFEWTHLYPGLTQAEYVSIIVPKALVAPVPRPLVPNTGFEPFNTALTKQNLSRIDIAPSMTEGNRYYPVYTDSGILVTANEQGYFVDGFINNFTYMPLIDGPRGVCTFGHTTDLRWGRNNKLYGSSPFSWWVVDATGAKRTLLGQRHIKPGYWAEADSKHNIEYVGNWDPSIPATEWYPKSSWFSVFDPDTLTLDMTAAPIGGEQPHIAGPTAYLGDEHGYVLKAVFNGHDRSVPPTVTRHIKVNDPFGGALRNGVLYVAERGAHKISMWDVKTGASLGDLLSEPNAVTVGAVVPSIRTFYYNSGQSKFTARNFTVCAPEGLAIVDDWLYFSSLAQAQVRRYNLVTKVLEIVVPEVPVYHPGQSHFVNLAVSDGTFGPKFTCFTTTYDNQYFGRPRAFLPDGTTWDYQYFDYDQQQGRDGGTLVDVYPMAVCVGQGGLAYGGSHDWLTIFIKAQANEVAPDYNRQQLGHKKWLATGYEMVYRSVASLPPLTDPDINYYRQINGI